MCLLRRWALALEYRAQRDREQEWNGPCFEVKEYLTLAVRQLKFYAHLGLSGISSAESGGCNSTENLSKWGPESIITEKASVHTLKGNINCSEVITITQCQTSFSPTHKSHWHLSQDTQEGMLPIKPAPTASMWLLQPWWCSATHAPSLLFSLQAPMGRT